MSKKYKIYLLASLFLHIVSCFIFFFGFLPLTHSTITKKDLHVNSTLKLPAKYDHLVFIVIDALRADFILGDGKWTNDMPFLREMIASHKAYSFRTRSRPPTVTMPRLKRKPVPTTILVQAITSGTIPGFTDLILNAASSAFTEDNIITKFKKSDRTMVFYGDDTWLKMFPHHFKRSEGTSSFFVKDFYEVDDNVTRNVFPELQQYDWEMMILHYLGLDHIGHVHGPNSVLIPTKLQEMDNIIKRITNTMINRNDDNMRTLICICGDHGMSDAGSHGGASEQEIYTPTIFLDTSSTVGSISKEIVIEQIDIAPTLAVLFGNTIPASSVGKFIPTFYNLYTAKEREKIQQLTACQFFNLLPGDKQLYELCDGDDKTFLESESILAKASSQLQNSVAGFNLNHMFFGVSLMFLSCLGFLATGRHEVQKKPVQVKEQTVERYYCAFSVFLTYFSMTSTSYIEEEHFVWYFLTSSYFMLKLLLLALSKDFPWRSAFECVLQPSRLENTLKDSSSKVVVDRSKFSKTESVSSWKTLVIYVLVLVLLRICRCWNGTGVKWLQDGGFIDDIHLHGYSNHLNIVTFISATTTLVFYVLRERTFVKILMILCYLAITANKMCDRFYTEPSNSCSISSAQISYMFIALVIVSYRFLSVNARTLSFLSCLLFLRLDNVLWYCLIVFIEMLLAKICKTRQLNASWQCIWLYIMLCKFTYFSHGNSNSLSTIDISTGMMGFTYYSPVVANIITYYATYSTQLFWFASLVDQLKETKMTTMKTNALYFFTSYQLLHNIIYTWLVFLQRYHLFIWSVFAPKLMYMMSSTLLTTLLFVLVIFTTPDKL